MKLEDDIKYVNKLEKMFEKPKLMADNFNHITKATEIANTMKVLSDSLRNILDGYDFTAFERINNLFKEINFSEIDKNFKKACELMLNNGFYPYGDMEMSLWKIVYLDNKEEIENKICSNVKIHVYASQKKFLNQFKEYKDIIYEIYNLYETKKYRLCILSQLNLISMVINLNFHNLDLSQCKKEVLENKGIYNEKNKEYCVFIPYIIEPRNENRLIANYKNKPEKYKSIPYNRNAIIHGYSKKFGTEVNCLRWFSVMLNVLDIMELYQEIKG